MLFELKSVFQNDGEEKQVEYNLDLSGLDVDGVYPFKTPVVVTAKATNRASLITHTLITAVTVTVAVSLIQER